MIYVPDLNYKCYVVQGEGIIRAYSEVPQNNRTVNYRDYYIKSNYLYRDNTQSFSSSTNLPVCLSKEILTNDFYYRNDFSNILFIFIVFAFVIVFVPLMLFKKLFRRWNYN